MTSRTAMRPVRSSPAFLLLLAGLVLAIALLGSCNGSSSAARPPSLSSALAPAGASVTEVCFRADAYTLAAGAVANAQPIPMWGFVKTGTGAGCGFGGAAPDGTAVVLPVLTATAGTYLNVHLQNNLAAGTSAYLEPVSITVPGQPFFGSDAPGSPGPTWFEPSGGTVSVGPRSTPTQRVRTFTVEAPLGPGGPGSVVTYAFGPLRPGTYLLESGTHPGVQVQMGLIGALVVNPATAGFAYSDPSSAYDADQALVFSEIDPVFHAAVGAGNYGPNANPPNGWITSPSDYHPRYFLVNGKPYTPGAPPIASVPGNARVLLRLVNGGLDVKVPVAGGRYMSLIAEDGNFYTASGKVSPSSPVSTCPAPRSQFTVMLPAGKTVDAVLTTPGAGTQIAVYDRRLNLSNAGASPGGMLALLTTVGGNARPPGPAVAPCTLGGP